MFWYNPCNPHRRPYRVLEEVKLGVHTFFPQERHLIFFWKKIVQEGFDYIKEEFKTLEEAEIYLYNRHITTADRKKADEKRRQKQKENTIINHPYDPVFHKLKR